MKGLCAVLAAMGCAFALALELNTYYRVTLTGEREFVGKLVEHGDLIDTYEVADRGHTARLQVARREVKSAEPAERPSRFDVCSLLHDEVTLQSGDVLRGRIVAGTPTDRKVRLTDGSERTVAKSSIKGIRYAVPPAPSAELSQALALVARREALERAAQQAADAERARLLELRAAAVKRCGWHIARETPACFDPYCGVDPASVALPKPTDEQALELARVDPSTVRATALSLKIHGEMGAVPSWFWCWDYESSYYRAVRKSAYLRDLWIPVAKAGYNARRIPNDERMYWGLDMLTGVKTANEVAEIDSLYRWLKEATPAQRQQLRPESQRVVARSFILLYLTHPDRIAAGQRALAPKF